MDPNAYKYTPEKNFFQVQNRFFLFFSLFFESNQNYFRTMPQTQRESVPDPGTIGNEYLGSIKIVFPGVHSKIEYSDQQVQSPDHAAVSVTG